VSDLVLESIRTHLEFLGYAVEPQEEQRYAVSHTARVNFIMRPFAGGVLFTVYFKSSDQAKTEPLQYLGFVNALNQNAAVARFYADPDGDLCIECWHPSNYERSQFGHFIQMWNRDNSELLQERPELSTFLL